MLRGIKPLAARSTVSTFSALPSAKQTRQITGFSSGVTIEQAKQLPRTYQVYIIYVSTCVYLIVYLGTVKRSYYHHGKQRRPGRARGEAQARDHGGSYTIYHAFYIQPTIHRYIHMYLYSNIYLSVPDICRSMMSLTRIAWLASRRLRLPTRRAWPSEPCLIRYMNILYLVFYLVFVSLRTLPLSCDLIPCLSPIPT